MRTIYLILWFILFLGCTDEVEQQEQEVKQQEQQLDTSSIYGTWELVEVWGGLGIGSMMGWKETESKYTLIFSLNNKFETTGYIECFGIKNNFKIEGDTIVVFFECNNFISERSYRFSFENGILEWSLASIDGLSRNCDEGCGERFKKILDE